LEDDGIFADAFLGDFIGIVHYFTPLNMPPLAAQINNESGKPANIYGILSRNSSTLQSTE
jgi:hypothetical protein